jgi:hypothetical protein
VGYGKCPEFVCVDGLIVSKEQADWRGGGGGVHEFYNSIFYPQGRKERHQSAESLDVGYGKCPEFVCVDGLIVSKEQADWRGEEEEEEDTEQSMISAQGTLTTLRYYERILLEGYSRDRPLQHAFKVRKQFLSQKRFLIFLHLIVLILFFAKFLSQ